MLDDFKDNKFYEYACNLKKYFHAYIFEVSDIDSTYPLILAFAKMIICKNHLTNNKQCDCNICHLIDENYYNDLKVIEPDGKQIRKEQIKQLQNDFSLKSANDTNQVYIIKEAEKMNDSASNSLLKFIEEPASNIYAILITTSRDSLLPTIISRCQIIELNLTNKLTYIEEDYQNNLKFLKLLQKEKENTLAYLKSSYFSIYQTREDVLKSFKILEIILDKEINRRNNIISDFAYYNLLANELKNFSLEELIFYLNKIINYHDKLIKNPYLNLNLFMDRLVIEISREGIK